jgi:FkbM family methyltransferase
MAKRILKWTIVVAISFAAGFFAHRADLHATLQPAIAYVTGRTGGCGLRQAYTAISKALDRNGATLRDSATLIEERDGLQHWQTSAGRFWTPPGNGWAYVLAEQTLRLYGDGAFRVQPGEVVIDAGANIGAFTREALNAGARQVVAIEPVPANVESLRRTFQSEIAEGKVVVVAKGVWNKDDVLEMNLFDNSALDSFVMATRAESASAARKLRLPLTTLDKIVGELALARVDFIKMDIEGAERQAIAGSRQTIERFKPRMALATENLPDDYQVVPREVAAIDPAYRSTCGSTHLQGGLTIRPNVLFFSR